MTKDNEINNKKTEPNLLSGLTLAYVGDAIYEVYVRRYLIEIGQTKPNHLHHIATRFVSAKAQAMLIDEMIQADILTETEQEIYKRGRNAKSHTSAKNADIVTYRMSTGFEAVMGYLFLAEETMRMEELIFWCIKVVEEKHGTKPKIIK